MELPRHAGKVDGGGKRGDIIKDDNEVIFGCSVAKLCLTLCDPMNCSTPGFPILHYLPEFAQIMSIESVMPPNLHPLSPTSPLALNLFQHQSLFQ